MFHALSSSSSRLCLAQYVKIRAAVIASHCFYMLDADRAALQLHIVLRVSGRWLPRQEIAMKPAGQDPDSGNGKDPSAGADSRWP
jgi:hypothetical protein